MNTGRSRSRGLLAREDGGQSPLVSGSWTLVQQGGHRDSNPFRPPFERRILARSLLGSPRA